MEHAQVILPLLIGLSGLVLSGLTLVLNYFEKRRQETESYRSALYAQQINQSVKLFDSIASARVTFAGIRKSVNEGDTGTSKRLAGQLAKAHTSVHDSLGASVVLLPNDILNAVMLTLTKWQSVVDSVESGRLDEAESAIRESIAGETKIILATRMMLGVDTLSAKSKTMFEVDGIVTDYDKVYQELTVVHGDVPM